VICMLVFEFRPAWHGTIFFVLCLLFFVLYSGPNVATFVLPVISYPSEVRSTFHGLSAAAAKIGAMAGSLLFPVIDDALGTTAVMATQALICAAGALLSHYCLRSCPEAAASQAPCAKDTELELAATVGHSGADTDTAETTDAPQADERTRKSDRKIERQKLVQ